MTRPAQALPRATTFQSLLKSKSCLIMTIQPDSREWTVIVCQYRSRDPEEKGRHGGLSSKTQEAGMAKLGV